MRSRKLAAGASSYGVEVVEKSTTEGEDTTLGTIEGVPTEVADVEKPYPSSY